jgi:uncharacterized protein YegP (UPF0339 family)
MWFEIYQDSCQMTEERWRWRLRSDLDVIAVSTKGYVCPEECQSAIRALTHISPKTPMKVRLQREVAKSVFPKKSR